MGREFGAGECNALINIIALRARGVDVRVNAIDLLMILNKEFLGLKTKASAKDLIK